MNYLFLCFLFIFPFLPFAQQTELIPFEDYKGCLTGFKNKKGEVILPAQFLHVRKERFQNQRETESVWIVNLGGKVGILSNDGSMLIPCEYEELFVFGSDLLLAKKEGEFGLVSYKNELRLPFLYDEINWLRKDERGKSNLKNYLLLQLNSRVGIMDEQFQFVIPLRYSFIGIEYLNQEFEEVAPIRFFRCYVDSVNKTFQALYDLEGREVFPLGDHAIEIIQADVKKAQSDYCFLVSNQTRKKADVYTSKGVKIVSGLSHLNGAKSLSENLKADTNFFVLFSMKEKYMLLNVHNGQLSPQWDQIERYENGFYFENKHSWGFCDYRFQILLKQKGGKLMQIGTTGLCGLGYLPELKYERFLKTPLVISENKRFSARKLSFRSIETGQYFSRKADDAFYKVYGLDTLLFSVKYENASNSQAGSFELYDQQLNKRGTFGYSALPMRNMGGGFNLFVFRDQQGKWGAISPEGNSEIPFVYGDFTLFYYNWKNYFLFSKDSLQYLYSQSGDLLLSSELIYSDANQILTKHHNTWNQVDSNFRIVHADYENMYKFLSSINGHFYTYLAAKAGYLYGIQGNSATKIDSTILKNWQAPNLGIVASVFLIDKSGRVTASGEIDYVGKLIFVKQRRPLRKVLVFNASGEKIHEFQGWPNYRSERDLLYLDFGNDSSALLHALTGDLILKVGKLQIQFSELDTCFWVFDPQEEQAGWKLINAHGKQLFQQRVDAPFHINTGENIIFSVGRYKGMMSPDFKLLLPPDNSQIIQRQGFYFFQSPYGWGIFKRPDQLINGQFPFVFRDSIPDRFIVHKRDSVGILNGNLEWILPLTQTKQAQEKFNLADLLNFSPTNLPKGFEFLLFLDGSKEALRKINNENILLYTVYTSTKSITHYATNNFYSGIRTRAMSATQYVNLRIIGDSLIPIKLFDLIRPDQESTLDELLTQEITSRQLFGPTCIDLNGVLEIYKKNFHLTHAGIAFFQPSAEQKYILISWKMIIPLLKEPALFGKKQ